MFSNNKQIIKQKYSTKRILSLVVQNFLCDVGVHLRIKRKKQINEGENVKEGLDVEETWEEAGRVISSSSPSLSRISKALDNHDQTPSPSLIPSLYTPCPPFGKKTGTRAEKPLPP